MTEPQELAPFPEETSAEGPDPASEEWWYPPNSGEEGEGVPDVHPGPDDEGEDSAEAESGGVVPFQAADFSEGSVFTPPGSEEPTVAMPEELAGVSEATLVQPNEPERVERHPQTEAIFREEVPAPGAAAEMTRVQPVSEEEQKLAAERAARREARAAALAAPPPQPEPVPEPVIIQTRTNDRFWGSLGLFLLRVVVAGIFAIRGMNILTDLAASQVEFENTVLVTVPPGPALWAIITGAASLLIALALLLGLATRLAGLGVALIAAGALVFVYWGPWSPFIPGESGFLGEYQLLLATVGVLLMLLGGGGWSLDRGLRVSRDRNRREKVSAQA